MPIILDPLRAQCFSYALCWGSPHEDGYVEVAFAHGPFQHDEFAEYAQNALNHRTRSIDGSVSVCLVRSVGQLEFVVELCPTSNFMLFESHYAFEVIRHHVHWLRGCQGIRRFVDVVND